jgi:hypothetical protein
VSHFAPLVRATNADRGRAPLPLPRRDRHEAVSHRVAMRSRPMANGPARCAMSRCWWRAPSMPRATARSSASARAPGRTSPAGRPCLTPPGRPWPERRAADHLRRLPRPRREHRRLLAGRPLAALHGAFYRNVFSHVPTSKVREISHMLKAIHARESREATQEKAATVVADLRRLKLGKAAELVEPVSTKP